MKTDVHDPFGEKVSCLERKIAQVSLNRESRYSCCFLRRKNATRGADGERKQASIGKGRQDYLGQNLREGSSLVSYFLFKEQLRCASVGFSLDNLVTPFTASETDRCALCLFQPI